MLEFENNISMKSLMLPKKSLQSVFLSLGFILGMGLLKLMWNPQNRMQILEARANFESDLSQSLMFRVYSNNVRNDASEADRFPHEHAWSERKEGVISSMKAKVNEMPTLIGLQEVKHNQLVDVVYGLNGNNRSSPWTFYGVGRDDGKESGEYSAILYNTDEWDLINGTYKWLSETPDVPSKSWGAATKRIVTITTFRCKSTQKYINFWNTHFDQLSEEARQNEANLILNWLRETPNNYPNFLSGDFNSLSDQVAYETINSVLADSREISYSSTNAGWPTYTGFEPTDVQTIIDFIWCPLDSNTNGSSVTSLYYEVIDDEYNGFKFSDHRPISSIFKVL